MKHLIAIVASAFALTAFAQGVPTPTAPAVAPAQVQAKKAIPPAKSQAPTVKDTKATTAVTK
jgi:hypothetical protein